MVWISTGARDWAIAALWDVMLLFLKLFKILLECVAPAQVYLVLRNYEPQ